jgi:hypothetical protein
MLAVNGSDGREHASVDMEFCFDFDGKENSPLDHMELSRWFEDPSLASLLEEGRRGE